MYLVGLAQQFRRLGHTVDVLLSKHSRMDRLSDLLAPCARVHRITYSNMYDRRLRSIGSVLDGRTVARLANTFREIKPDIIHLNKQNLEDGLDLLLAARRSNLPRVATIHITHGMASLRAIGGRTRDFVARRVLRKSGAGFITVAESCRGELHRFLGATGASAPVAVVHNGVAAPPPIDRQAVRDEWRCRPDDIVLGCVVRIEEQKNPLFAIDLLALLPKNVRLVWIGDGRLRSRFEAAAAQAGVANRLIVDGWRDDAASRMAAFDIFMLPSLYEGLPLALLEAMAAGLPAVVSDADGVREAIVDRRCGRLLAPNDRDSWLAAIIELIENSELRTNGVKRLASGTNNVSAWKRWQAKPSRYIAARLRHSITHEHRFR